MNCLPTLFTVYADNTMLGSFHIRIEVVQFAYERGCKLVEMTGVGEVYCVANRRNTSYTCSRRV